MSNVKIIAHRYLIPQQIYNMIKNAFTLIAANIVIHEVASFDKENDVWVEIFATFAFKVNCILIYRSRSRQIWLRKCFILYLINFPVCYLYCSVFHLFPIATFLVVWNHIVSQVIVVKEIYYPLLRLYVQRVSSWEICKIESNLLNNSPG